MSEPVRLARLHPASILFHWFAVVRSGAVPLALVALQARRGGDGRFLYGLLALLLVYVLGSFARYLATRYGLTDDALHVRSGVLARQSRVVPFGRIQAVNVRQSALQRLLRMGELHVETATQGLGAEVVLKVLPWRDAQALREQLVAERRRALGADEGPTRTTDAELANTAVTGAAASLRRPAAASPAPVVVAALDVEQLMIAGGTSNNVMALLALLVSGCERVRSSFFDDLDLTDGVVGALMSVGGALGGTWAIALTLLLVVVPLLVGAWLLSVGGAVVRWYGFTLEQVGRDLRRRHGLFSRMESSVPLQRAQAVRFHESMLRRPFGLGELHLVSAGSASGAEGSAGGRQMLLPILRRAQLGALVPAILPGAALSDALDGPMRAPAWRRPRPIAVLRLAMASTLWVGVLLAALAVVRPGALSVAAWLLPFTWGLAVLRQRARGLALVDGHVLVREGGLARTTIVLPEPKLQLIEVRQGPLQRLVGTATLRLTTAGVGGDADMVDLALDDARALQEDLTARLPRCVRRVALSGTPTAADALVLPEALTAADTAAPVSPVPPVQAAPPVPSSTPASE